MGVKNLVISASPQGILVSNKHQSSYIKPYVDSIEQKIMFDENEWGEYRILDSYEGNVTVKLTIKNNKSIDAHLFGKGNVSISVINDDSILIDDSDESFLSSGTVVAVERNEQAYIKATSDMSVILVNIGSV